MAGPREIGLGVASVLASDRGPHPLLLSFRGQSLDEAGTLVLQILTECRDAGIVIKRLELDPDLFREIADVVDVPVRSAPDLNGEVRFYRRLPG